MAGVSVHAGLLMVLWALTDNIVLFYMGSAGVGALLNLSGWRVVQVALEAAAL